MCKNMIYTVLGADKRQLAVARLLAGGGGTVRICGSFDVADAVGGIELFADWRMAISGCNALILPLPMTRDGVTLPGASDLNGDPVKLDELVRNVLKNKDCVVLGGMPSREVTEKFKRCNVTLVDYYDDVLKLKNALPSAEGAIMLAMQHTDKVLNGMKVLVCGYGRIGGVLADLLYKLGADVTVAARRDESLCEAALNGFRAVRISSVPDDSFASSARECDVIFNTVPHRIFTGNILRVISARTLYIEIASAPFGIDASEARDAGVQVIYAPSIPAKYAPVTAGEYIFDSIADILRKRGVEI